MTAETDVDDRPDWAIKGRRVESQWRKRRQAKRARRFVMVNWGELAPALRAAGAGRAIRLLLVLHLHDRLQRTRSKNGWIELIRHDLEAVGLVDGQLCRAVAKLEACGLVEAQRRPGKRPLLRLVRPKP